MTLASGQNRNSDCGEL